MESSILGSMKDAAGVNAEDNAFDQELILIINSAFMTLRQLGVGPSEPFYIQDDSAVWGDFSLDTSILPMIKSYVSLKVRELFDPPQSSAFATALHDTIAEYEWRLNLETDPQEVTEEGG